MSQIVGVPDSELRQYQYNITRRRARRGTALRQLQDKYIDRMVVLQSGDSLHVYDFSGLRRGRVRWSDLRMHDGECLEVYKVDYRGVYTRHRRNESTEQFIGYEHVRLPEEF